MKKSKEMLLRTVSMFLVVLLCIGNIIIAVPEDGISGLFVKANAATVSSGTCGDNLTWTLDDSGTLTISGTGDMWDWDDVANVPWVEYRSTITNLEFSEEITSIGYNAFWNCSQIKNVVVPGSVTSINGGAFAECSSLESISIPDDLSYLGVNAFVSCISLKEIDIPSGISELNEGVFGYCKSLTTVDVPDNITAIWKSAFYECTSLKSVSLPDSVVELGDYVFTYCSSLENIYLPDSIKNMGNYIFAHCTSLENIEMPDGVDRIGTEMFVGCLALSTINISSGVKSIGDSAFVNCSKLTGVNYWGTEEEWSSISFGANNECLKNATVYYCSEQATSGICGDNVTWELDNEGTLTISGTGAMYEYFYIDANAPWYYLDRSRIKNVVVEDGVTCIGGTAFYDCQNLESVTIPDSVTRIGGNAFFWCTSLKSVNIPDTVTSVESGAFAHCYSLESIKLPSNITVLPVSVLDECRSLETLTIPNSVTTIEHDAFTYCRAVKEIVIPSSVKTIERGVFYCWDSLTDIYYSGSESEWNSISIGTYNESLSKATIHYNWVVDEEILYDFLNVAYSFENPTTQIYYAHYKYTFGDNEMARVLFEKKAGIAMKEGKNEDLDHYTQNGVCAGMVRTSLLLNNNDNNYNTADFYINSFFSKSYAKTIRDIIFYHINDKIDGQYAIDYIKEMFLLNCEYLFQVESAKNMYFNKDVEFLQNLPTTKNLQKLVDTLLSGTSCEIVIAGCDGAKCHSVLPYKIVVENENSAKIYVYDCNFPNDDGLYITVSKSETGGVFDTWEYSCGTGEIFQYGSKYDTGYKGCPSYISFWCYSDINSRWKNIGDLNIHEDMIEEDSTASANALADENASTDDALLLSLSPNASCDIALIGSEQTASIKGGYIVSSEIDGMYRVMDSYALLDGEVNEEKSVLIYVPEGKYEITNTDESSISAVLSDSESSVAIELPSEVGCEIIVGDNVSSEAVFTFENSQSNDFAFRYRRSDTEELFDSIVISGNSTGDSVKAQMTEEGLLVDGMDTISAEAMRSDKHIETSEVDTINSSDSSVLITIDKDNIVSFDEDTDSDGSFDTNLLECEAKTVAREVEITNDDVRIACGGSAKLNAVLLPTEHTDDPTVYWSSEDESVATVSETGVVTATGIGTTRIHCSIGAFVSDSIYVTVTDEMVLNANEAIIKPNETYDIKIVHLPENITEEIIYTSSNSKVATVDSNGVVTAHALGTAVITATAGDASASCTIEVIPPISLTAMGGSVRIVEPYGLRFGIQLKKDDAYNQYKDIIVGYGTLIIPKKNLGDAPLTFATDKVKDVPAVNIYSEDSTQLTYTGVLVGIPKSSFYSDIVGRGYLKYLDIDGNEKVIYTDEIVRSYYQVANSAYTRYGNMTDRDATEQAVYEKLAALLAEMTDGDNITS